jgi:outer membrane protein assembly factor BamB
MILPRTRPSGGCLVLLLAGFVLAGCGGGGASPPLSVDAPPAAGEAPPTAGGSQRPVDLEEQWRWPAPPPGSVGMPSADDEAVAATYGHLRLVLLGLDGDVRWEAERVGLRDVAPALTGDVVVAATEDGLMAVDRETGRVRWDTKVGERANSPVVVGRRAVVSTWEGSLMAFDLDDGRVAWRSELPGPAIGPAATDGETVVATWETETADAAGAVAVDGADGRRRWSVPLVPGGVGGPAVVALPEREGGADGEGAGDASRSVVVLVAGDIAAHGLDLSDGRERWRADSEGRGSPEVPPLALDDGEVLVAHRLAGLFLADADTGAVRWGGKTDGVAVRGGPAGLGPDGPFAFPIDDGRLLVAGPTVVPSQFDLPGRVSGVAVEPGGLLLVATREARANHLVAYRIAPGAGS